MFNAIIAQAADKIKSDFGTVSQTGVCTEDFGQSFCDAKFKVGDIATDGSFSCRPIVRIECLEDSFVYHFEGVVRGCSEHTLLHPDESNQPLMPRVPPISAAKYKVGDVATVLIGSYLFACRRIVRIERLPDSAFHYVFCGITGAFRESDVVLAEDTTPKMPHWDGVPCSLCSFRETKCCTGNIANAKYKAGDIATVQINASSLFPPDMIVKIESNDGAFHYFFESDQCGYREEDVVLAKIPLCPPLTRQKLTLATLHSTETLHHCALSSDFDTNDTAKSSPSVPPQNYDKQHYQPADCHSSSDTYSFQLPDSTRIVFYPEYESNKHWQNPPQYLDDFPDKADRRPVNFGVPLDEQGDEPVPDEPSEELLVAHARRLALNYQHDGNSFGPQKSSLPQPTAPAPAPVVSTGRAATKKQIRFGAKFGLDLSGSTCVEASLAIEKAMAEFGPPATDNQKTYLERYGVDTTNISFDAAKVAIEEVAVWREGLAAEIHSELDGRRSANGWYRCECLFCPPSKSLHGTPKRDMGYTIESGGDFDEIGFVCHKCGEKGGTLDLANELEFSLRGVISFSKKKKVPVVPKPEVKEEPLWKQSPRQYQIDLASHSDLNSRWQGYKPLLPETIERFGLGYGTPPDRFYGPGLIIPVTENGEIVGFRCRHTTGKFKNQWRTVTGSKTTLFNGDLVTEGCIVVVTENNIDSLLLMQEIPEIDGIPVVGVSSSSGVWSWRKEWSKTLARARLVVMATDNDHAGQPSEEYQVLLESEHQLKTDARAAEGKKPLPPLRLPGGFKAYRSLLKAGANVVVFPWAVDKMDVGDYLTGVIANKALSEGGPINEQWSVHAGRAGKEEASYEERFGFLNEESVFHDFLARHRELNVRECKYVRPRLWAGKAAELASPGPRVTGTIYNRATVERISIAELRRRRRDDAQRIAALEPELDAVGRLAQEPSVTGTIYNRATVERISIAELNRRKRNDAQRTAAPEPIEQPLRTPEPPPFPPEPPTWINEEPPFPPEEPPFLTENPPFIPEQPPWINEDSASLEAEYWANDPYPCAPPWMNETPLSETRFLRQDSGQAEHRVNFTESSSFLRTGELIMLPSDKKVSDIFDMNSLPLGISLVQAPPSGGKSTAAIRQFDKWRILLVPTQDLAKQKGNETDEPIVLEGFSPRFDDDRRLISTYDGLLKIVRKAAKLVEDLSKYNLVIDEFHRFVTDDYRDILRDVLALAPRFNRIVLMTATPPPALPLAGPIYYVKIVPEIKPELHVFSAHVTDYSSVILNELKDVELVEYHENDKAKCLAIKEVLERRGVTGIYLFNADTKKLDYHKKMINEGTLPDDASVLLVTSLYNDGFNFFTQKRRSLIITAKSRLSAIDMEQFSARIRNNPAVRAILARLGKTEAEPFDYQRTIASKRARAQMKATVFNAWHESIKSFERDVNGEEDDEHLNEIARRTIERDGGTKGLIYAEGKWRMEMLTCDQRSHSAWATACNRDHQFMVSELNKFGNYDWCYMGEYQFREKQHIAKAIKKETTEAANKEREEHREAVREAASQITSIVEAEKIDTNWQNQTLSDSSYKAASRILKLVDAGMLFESAHEFMSRNSRTPNAVTRLAAKTELASFRIGTDAGRLASEPQSQFLRAFMDLFLVGERVSWDGRGGTRNVREAIFSLRGISIEADYAYQLEHLKDEEQQRKKVMGLLSDCFGVKDAKVVDEGKRKDAWEIASLVAVCFEKLRPLQIQKEPEFDADDSDMEEVREVHQASLHLDTESVQPDTSSSFSSLERGDTDDSVYSPTPVNPYGW